MDQTQSEKSTSPSCICKYDANTLRKIKSFFTHFAELWIGFRVTELPRIAQNALSRVQVCNQVTNQLPCIGWIQVLKFLKYNSGIQQICFAIKAQPHTHKSSRETQRQVGKPKWVFSVCLCVFAGNSLSLGWAGGHGAAVPSPPSLSDPAWCVFL